MLNSKYLVSFNNRVMIAEIGCSPEAIETNKKGGKKMTRQTNRDNRANQLNRNNERYWKARGVVKSTDHQDGKSSNQSHNKGRDNARPKDKGK